MGRELVTTGIRQVEESDDEGETAMEIAECMRVIVEALDRSSLDPADKLTWALDALLEYQFEVCEAFAEYLPATSPNSLAHAEDLPLARLYGSKSTKGADDFSRNYNVTGSAIGPSMPWSEPAGRLRSSPCASLRRNGAEAMTVWSNS